MNEYKVRVYPVGLYNEPSYEGTFKGTPAEADRHLSTMWNEHTPADGTGWRATLRLGRRVITSIGW